MKKRPICQIAFFLMMGILILDWLGLSWIWRSPAGSFPLHLAEQEETVTVKGQIYCQEEKETNHQIQTYLYLKNTSLITKSKIYPIRNLKCYVKGSLENREGCVVLVQGKFILPPLPTNPGEFNARQYERGKKIDYHLEDARICRVVKEENAPGRVLRTLKRRIQETISKIYPEKEAGILNAMILGEKADLDKEIKAQYQAAGISHILAISGLHITMTGMAVWKVLMAAGCPLWLSSGGAFMTLVLYGAFIGAPSTAFRAVAMFGIMAGGKIAGRAYDMSTSLSLAVILLLTDNPDLLWDGGFQLSVMAVFCLILCGTLSIKKAAVSGLFLWFGMLPVVLYHFYQVSLSGCLWNLFVIPVMPVILGSAAIAVAVGSIHVFTGSIAAVPSWFLLKIFEMLGRISEKTKFAVWTPGKMTIQAVILYYIIFGAAIVGIYKIQNKKKSRRIMIIVAAILLYTASGSWKDQKEMAMLDVGQGDGIILQEGSNGILVDGGSTSKKEVGKNILIPYLKHQGIINLEGIFITHTDQDHINGAVDVIRESGKGWLHTEKLYMPIWMKETEQGKMLAEEADISRVDVEYLKKGDRLKDGQIDLKIIHPGTEDFAQAPNDGSLVFYCVFCDRKILFTGDLTSEQEHVLLPELQQCEILKTGHHGAGNASSPEFLYEIKPHISLISCGKNNKYGHPAKDTLERLEQIKSDVYRTDISGALILDLKGELLVKCTCPGIKGKVYYKQNQKKGMQADYE